MQTIDHDCCRYRSRSDLNDAHDGNLPEVTSDDPGQLLAHALGAQTGTAERIRRGAIGAIWRLRLTGYPHRELAAKEFITYLPDEHDVAAEVAFRDAAAAAGVPSPRPIRFRTGYLTVDPQSGRGWRCYDWVDGHSAPENLDTCVWLVRQLAAMHSLRRTEPSPPEDDFSLRVDADWPALATAVRAADLPWASRLERLIESELPALLDLVDSAPAGTPIWSHRDLQPANVIVAAGERWLVDWDNAGGTSDWSELGSQLIRFVDDPADLRTLLAAYHESGGTARVDGSYIFAGTVAAHLNFLAGQAHRLIDPSSTDEDHDYARGWLPGLVDDLPTRERLDDAARILTA